MLRSLLLTCHYLVYPSSSNTPSFLDEKNAKNLHKVVEKYYVKIDPSGCGHNCEVLDETWSQFSEFMPARSVWRLDCASHHKLCKRFIGNRLLFLETHKQPEVVVVVGSIYSRECVLERYSGSHNVQNLMTFLQEAFARPLAPLVLQHSKQVAKKPELAVLVLATEGLVRGDVWCSFLNQGKASKNGSPLVSMFIHDRSHTGSQVCEGAQHVPTVVSQRETVSLVRATIQLLRHAIAAGGADRYVLVSGDSIPILPLRDVSKALALHEGYSLFQLHQQQDSETDARFHELRNQGRLKATREMFIKISNWMVLDHHAATFFSDLENDHTREFEPVQMPDEHYFVTLCERFGLPWREAPIMYDIWPKKKSRHPKKLTKVTFSTRAGKYMFARKITQDTRVDIGVIHEPAFDIGEEL